ncbi:hypothetical protein [Streptomyces sp. NPDC054765]
MTIAALPDHNNTTHPLWLKLFHSYRHVIAPLRHNGWPTDIEIAGGENRIHADLGDGTELIIASVRALPLDPNEVTGWSVLRLDIEDNARHTVLYDSTPEGAQSHHRNSLIPLFGRIDELDAPKPMNRLVVSATYTSPSGMNHYQAAGSETPGAAVARFFEWSRLLVASEGYQHVWERPEEDGYPLARYERDGHVTTVQVTRSDD